MKFLEQKKKILIIHFFAVLRQYLSTPFLKYITPRNRIFTSTDLSLIISYKRTSFYEKKNIIDKN
jgi:hypothetical protein